MTAIDVIDYAAFAWFILLVTGFQVLSARPAIVARSIAGGMQKHRVEWMRTMAERENRGSDAILLSTLGQGNAFFASTSAIAIGGLAAIVGSADKADAVLAHVPFVAKTSALLWQLKVVLLIGIFVYAFFKFAWAFRLTHYTAIMVGAMPNPGMGTPADVDRQVQATARINGLAADHSNSGLRSFYYAAAALTWFFNPFVFIAATTWVGLILIRRDFFSRSRRLIATGQ